MRRLAASLADRWKRFWFTPTDARVLGLLRILFFAGVLVIHLSRDLRPWVRVPAGFWEPIWIFRKFDIGVVHAGILNWMTWTLSITLATALIGFFTRTSIAVSLPLAFYLFALPQNFGKVGHGDPALLFTMIILLISRCGDALSIDALVARSKGRSIVNPSPEYRWPIRAVWLLLAIMFFAAGCTKLMRAGLDWVMSDHFEILLLQHQYVLSDPVLPQLAAWLAARPMLCKFVAGGALTMELVFPLALLFPRLRLPFVLAGLSMQIGIALLMGVFFWQWLLIYMFWLPWDRIVERVAPLPVSDAPADDRKAVAAVT